MERQGAEWLKARYHAVTGTDVGKILGCDRETSRTKLLKTKAKEIDPLATAGPITQTYLFLGRQFEAPALEYFKSWASSNWIGYRGYVPGMTTHPIFKWLTGTPDYVMEKSNGDKAIVEIKTHFWPELTRATPIQSVDEIPLKHWLQVQTYMEIYDLNEGWLFSWTFSNGYTVFKLARDKDFWDRWVFPQIWLFWRILETVRNKYGSKEWMEASTDLKWRKGHRKEMVDLVSARVVKTTTQFGKYGLSGMNMTKLP